MDAEGMLATLAVGLVAISFVGGASGQSAQSTSVDWEEWQANGSSGEDDYTCMDAININTFEVRHSSCVDQGGSMYQVHVNYCQMANPLNQPYCYRMDSSAHGFSGFSTTDGRVESDNHGQKAVCLWNSDPVEASCPTGTVSSFTWGGSSPTCHYSYGDTYVYVGGTYNPSLGVGVPIPNHHATQPDEACP